jgi:hypothetical protein
MSPPHHHPLANPALRLVTDDEIGRWLAERDRQAAIARENRAAAGAPDLASADVRWVLAAHARAQLQGSALTPERRERVMRLATRLGVRPFDANLIIAIVQDVARRGGVLGDAVPTLALVAPPAATARREWIRWTAAAAGALAGSGLLIWWLLG